MELIDGVIQGYEDQKDSIYNLIEAKKAQAVLSANEELYTTAIQGSDEALQNLITTQGIYNQSTAELNDLQAKATELNNMTAAEYAELNGLTYDMGFAAQALANEQEEMADKVLAAKAAVGESRVAMGLAQQTYEGYQATIQNYEGLSAAIISGDQAKISEALLNMQYDFQTTETSTRKSLEQQVTNYETNLETLKKAIEDGTPGVTQEMVDQAQSMVDAAKAELDKLPPEAETKANTAATSYYTSLGSQANQNQVKASSILLRDSANTGLQPNGEEKTAGDNLTLGYIGGMKLKIDQVDSTAKGIGSGAVDSLNEGQESHSPSAATTTSGENFGQGFINGMGNKESSIWQKAWNLAKTAVNALKAAQEEGSPSKITAQSGKFFGQGFANGISDMIKPTIQQAIKLVSSAISAANNEMSQNQIDLLDMFDMVGFSDDTLLSNKAKKWLSISAKDLRGSLELEDALMSTFGKNQIVTNYYFTQNNTSPKALSRLEIYRQTKNQLLFAKEI